MVDRACTECIHHQLVRKRQGRKQVTRHECTEPASVLALTAGKAKARRVGVSCDDARRMNDVAVCGPRARQWAPKVSP